MITDTCGCGARINICRKYHSEEERSHDAWLAAHAVCRGKGQPPLADLAERIVLAFEEDFTDRKGLKKEWEQTGEAMRVSIRQTWTRIVRDELKKENKHEEER